METKSTGQDRNHRSRRVARPGKVGSKKADGCHWRRPRADRSDYQRGIRQTLGRRRVPAGAIRCCGSRPAYQRFRVPPCHQGKRTVRLDDLKRTEAVRKTRGENQQARCEWILPRHDRRRLVEGGGSEKPRGFDPEGGAGKDNRNHSSADRGRSRCSYRTNHGPRTHPGNQTQCQIGRC
ncbi:hypothetical protein [Klebsiella phage vB_KshKPC-M]|nr:hypothetical protein [Klebsiella phage vB_KshKPC-M]